MNVADVKTIVHTIRGLMDAEKDRLIELDSRIGDGDLGLTMVRAFTAADEHVAGSEETDVGKLLSQAGMAMAKAAPSTMGTLVATGFMRGGKELHGSESFDESGVATFFRAFADGIMERGKSKPGEKTIVDLVDPIARDLSGLSASEINRTELAARLRSTSRDALDAVEGMISQHGKAAIYREQTKGKPDPGAYAGALIVEGFARVLEEL